MTSLTHYLLTLYEHHFPGGGKSMSFEVRPTRVLTLGPSPNAFGALENHSLSRLGFLLQFGGYSSAHLVVSSLELKKKARKKGQTWPSRQGSGGAVSWGWGRAG